MQFSVLSSGSRANSTYIRCGDTRILIDVGLSHRETERRLQVCGTSLAEIDAIVITHEHSDHVRGLINIPKKTGIPVFINRQTRSQIGAEFEGEYFRTGEPFCVKDVYLWPFRIEHDAIDPVGFIIMWQGLRLGHATDFGKATTLVKDALSGCHALVIEANHDKTMLEECDYPWVLKQRIASTHGHLSNADCAEILSAVSHSDLSQVVLGHISKNSNTPTLAEKTVTERCQEAHFSSKLICASEFAPTGLFSL
jgi:phosphoribosyl 1,2-cyclic phosphodiesterase